jgi:TusA-related sulfurtransferase
MTTTIDTRLYPQYSPLIPAMHALRTAAAGDELEVVMTDATAFADFKEYLSEQHTGFREIYDGEVMTLQFSV